MSVVYSESTLQARELIGKNEFRRAYELLINLSERTAEWFYLTGLSAMKIGKYEEGEDYLKRAKFMDPENSEYSSALDSFSTYRNDYNYRADGYNRRRNNDVGGCLPCCCCCGDDCSDLCCQLWCADSCCECMGGDLITCC
ncbi:MAG: CDC27 family protein [Clostridioides sp.]|jgi:tetratricopeptide (TPR) repeat protein|nr:CDC27 family protein [Clostridioides sp.]